MSQPRIHRELLTQRCTNPTKPVSIPRKSTEKLTSSSEGNNYRTDRQVGISAIAREARGCRAKRPVPLEPRQLQTCRPPAMRRDGNPQPQIQTPPPRTTAKRGRVDVEGGETEREGRPWGRRRRSSAGGRRPRSSTPSTASSSPLPPFVARSERCRLQRRRDETMRCVAWRGERGERRGGRGRHGE